MKMVHFCTDDSMNTDTQTHTSAAAHTAALFLSFRSPSAASADIRTAKNQKVHYRPSQNAYTLTRWLQYGSPDAFSIESNTRARRRSRNNRALWRKSFINKKNDGIRLHFGRKRTKISQEGNKLIRLPPEPDVHFGAGPTKTISFVSFSTYFKRTQIKRIDTAMVRPHACE